MQGHYHSLQDIIARLQRARTPWALRKTPFVTSHQVFQRIPPGRNGEVCHTSQVNILTMGCRVYTIRSAHRRQCRMKPLWEVMRLHGGLRMAGSKLLSIAQGRRCGLLFQRISKVTFLGRLHTSSGLTSSRTKVDMN